MLRKFLKILLTIIVSPAGVFMLLIVLIGSGLLNPFVINTITKQAGKSLNGEIAIGSLKGSILSDFSLNDVIVEYEFDTLLYSREIRIDYQPFRLLNKELRIDALSLKDISLKLEQYQDSTWNFMKILKDNTEVDTISEASDWKIVLNDLKVERLSAAITSPDTSGMIPALTETGFKLDFSLYGDTIVADLDSMKIITLDPDLSVTSLTGLFSKRGDRISWHNVDMSLENSFLSADGTFEYEKNDQVDATLEITPLEFEDIKDLFPGISVYGHPEINISLSGSDSLYSFNTEILREDQNLKITGWISDVKSNPGYFADLIMNDIDISQWLQNNMATDISGKIEISGKGFDIKKNELNLKAEFDTLKYADYLVNQLKINISKNEEKINGTLVSKTFAGDVDIKYDLSNIFGNPGYDILFGYRNLNIGNLPGVSSASSDLNGNIRVKGRGISPDEITAEVIMQSENSVLSGYSVGNFMFEGKYNKGNYLAEIEGFGAPYFELNARGSGDLKRKNNISFSLVPLDVKRLATIFGFPDVGIAGMITGNISGTPDFLQSSLRLAIDSISYDTIKMENVNSEAEISYADKKLSGTLQMKTGNIYAGDLRILSAGIIGNYSENMVGAEITVDVTDSLQTEFAGTVEGFDNPSIHINHLGINYKGSEWETPHDSAKVNLNEKEINISAFELASGEQDIKIDGSFAFEGRENMNVDLSNIDLRTLPLDIFIPFEISGYLNSSMSLTGTSSQPVLNSHFAVDGIIVNSFEIDSLRTDATYDKKLLSISGKVLTNLYQSVDFNLNVPISLSLNDTIAVLKEDPGLNGSIRIDSLDINKLSEFSPVKNLSFEGFADAEIEVKNSINNPLISGILKLSDGRFANQRSGSEFEDIRLFASIDSSTVSLDTLSLRTGKGKLAMNGYISLENTDSLELNDLSLKLKSENFQVVDANFAELNFNSELDLSGTLGRPAFKGNLRINDSKINIDYFNEMVGKKTDQPDPPLLVSAISDTLNIDAGADSTVSGPSFTATDFYKNLSGEATVDIPGNTWVTGRDMNFELNGTVRAVKTTDNISLFGDMNIKRGYYKIYGRNFDFEKGKITFTGSAGFNPDVDFEIVYSFRDIEKELRDLKLLVTGKLMQPDLRFVLDDEAVEEKDAISYIVFGKSVNQLGEGEREKMSGQDVAIGAAVTQLSSVLKDVLQESAGVDVFEVSGGEDWKSGSVTIGKYITNNLFLSYDRSFDFNKQSKTPVTEKIMLEYQLIRSLMLKATNQDINSGFDLIWRKTWK